MRSKKQVKTPSAPVITPEIPIGKRIKARRLELGLTQEAVATLSGYKSRSSINKIELSRTLPLKKIIRVAEALDISPAELAGLNKTKVIRIDGFHDVSEKLLENKELFNAVNVFVKLPESDQKIVINLVKDLSHRTQKH